MSNQAFYYKKALPVWQTGAVTEKNVTLSFVATLGKASGTTVLYVSAACSFTVFINGTLIAHGPARTAHEFYRVDEIDLTPHLINEKNTVVVRVTGYNVDTFAYLDQPSFFCAEIVAKDCVLAATGADGFSAYRMTERVQKVQRYSYQRPFIEVYRLTPDAFAYEQGKGGAEVTLEAVGSKNFLTRSAPYGDYGALYPKAVKNAGAVTYSEKEKYHGDRSITRVTESNEQFGDYVTVKGKNGGEIRQRQFYSKGFPIDVQEVKAFVEVGNIDVHPEGADSASTTSLSELCVGKDRFVDLDMGANETGLFAFDLTVHEETTLYVLFDEIMHDDVLNPFRIGSSNIFMVKATPGTYHIVSAEPYVCRFVRLVAKDGAVTVKDFHMIEVAFPMSAITAKLKTDDENLRLIFDAAVRTFRANTVDVYMDCPSRERAGWLCDSFFTSRVERTLTGKSDVELDFLEAFVLRDSFPTIPDKMLPMCYPSDHHRGEYIPNWAMWYVLELGEYYSRTGDRAFVERAKHTVLRLYDWFKPFENDLGLLEKLSGWVFVEWSKANELVQDVSFASNMLYASFLDVIATLYDCPAEKEKAERIRETIRRLAFCNGYFCDNAVRNEKGELVLSGECTESCQYYAFFCDVATPETYPELWETLVRDFGFDRRTTKKHPEIHFANAFIGNYLRLDLLRRYGYDEMLLQNIRSYFTYMAECTGTLWEYEQSHKSLNHGFASHVLYWMEALGLVERN